MKIRQGFVSNSSSSSFVVYKKFLNPHQADALKRHVKVLNCPPEDEWDVTERANRFFCSTTMDNFSLKSALVEFGVHEEAFGVPIFADGDYTEGNGHDEPFNDEESPGSVLNEDICQCSRCRVKDCKARQG